MKLTCLAAALVLCGCLDDAVIARVRDASEAVDAALPQDAPPPDAPLADAPAADVPVPDAPPADAPPADAPLPDAPPPDAPPPDAAPDASGLGLRATVTGNGFSNAAAPEGFTTNFSVLLTLDGRSLDDATVRVASPVAEHALDRSAPGHYDGAQAGWYGRYTLTVQRGAAVLWTGAVAATAAHRFTAPLEDMGVSRTLPLTVTWSPSGASDALFTSPGALREVPDNGATTIPASSFPRDGTDESMAIRLRRADDFPVDGLAPGSFVRFEITNVVNVRLAR